MNFNPFKRKRLSVALIVKNEEPNLARCLDSIKEVADEIVILDTGSTDNTKKIARKYTRKIYDFKWNDNFSEAKNASFKYCTCNWILPMAADEELMKESLLYLKKVVSKKERSMYRIIERHFSDDGGAVINEQVRLFPNFLNIEYENRIHETFKRTSSDLKINEIVHKGIVLNHYGFLRAEKNRTQKDSRNLRLLLKEVEENPHKLYMHYYIAQEYYILDKIEEATHHLYKIINNKELVLRMVSGVDNSVFVNCSFLILISILKKTRGLSKAMELFQDSSINNPDFLMEIGTFFAEEEMWDKALSMYNKVIDVSQHSRSFGPIYDAGSVTWKPFVAIANTYVRMSDFDNASKFFKRSLDFNLDPSMKKQIEGIIVNLSHHESL